MGFGRAIRTCIAKYFVLSGRAGRAEYWWFMLGSLIASVVAGVVDGLSGLPVGTPGPASSLLSLLLACPSLTVLVRRLHDTGHPGWHAFVPLLGIAAGLGFGAAFGPALGRPASVVAGLLIVAGFLLPLWWTLLPSQPGANRFGQPASGAAA